MARYFFSISRGRSLLEARQVFTSTDPKLTIAAIHATTTKELPAGSSVREDVNTHGKRAKK